MAHLIKKTEYGAKRVLSLSLACLMILTMIPALTTDTSAGFEGNSNATDEALNLMTVYKWHRVQKQSDLPTDTTIKHPVLVMWKYGGKNYYCYDDGKSYKKNKEDAIKGVVLEDTGYTPDPFNADASNNTFFTPDKLTNITMRMTGGTDGKNEDAKKAKFWFNGSLITGYDDWDWEGNKDSASYDSWSIYTNDLDGEYHAPLSAEYPVQIYCEMKGKDTGWRHSDDYAYDEESSTYSYGAFAMYWAEEIKVSAITAPYTIRSGMVMNVDNGVILKEGVTLTVMPGGVLSIEGQFYNNGTIRNYGTIVVQPNSCITGFLPQQEGAGSIINSGKKVDIRAEAKEELSKQESILKDYKEKVNKSEKICSENRVLLAAASKEREEALNTVDEEQKITLALALEKLQNAVDSAAENLENATEADKEKCEEALDEAQAAYNAKYEPIKKYDAQIDESNRAISAAEAVIQESGPEIERLEKLVKELGETANSKTLVAEQGEGNLLVMKNARVVFDPKTKGRLTIENGGSCVCSGYIIHPADIQLSSGKLYVRSGGAVMGQFKLTQNILNAKDLTVSNQGTLDVGINGMAPCTNLAQTCMRVKGDYVIRVDGVFRYAGGPILTDEGTAISVSKGSGVWTTGGTPGEVIDPETGETIETLDDGTEIRTNHSTGVITYYYLDGRVVVRYPNGETEETWPNGSYIKRFADGSYEEANFRGENYIAKYYPEKGALIITYIDPFQSNGLSVVTEYDDGSKVEEYTRANGSVDCYYYDTNGSLYKIIMGDSGRTDPSPIPDEYH